MTMCEPSNLREFCTCAVMGRAASTFTGAAGLALVAGVALAGRAAPVMHEAGHLLLLCGVGVTAAAWAVLGVTLTVSSYRMRSRPDVAGEPHKHLQQRRVHQHEAEAHEEPQHAVLRAPWPGDGRQVLRGRGLGDGVSVGERHG
jgi:hypothetical protein